MKQDVVLFFCTLKQKQLLMNVVLTRYFESIYVNIMSKIQKPYGKGSSWYIDSLIDLLLIFQRTIL